MCSRGKGKAAAMEGSDMFSRIAEDILINIFSKLEDDPRYLARLACVCTRFGAIIRSICWKNRCMRVIPAVVADLLQATRRAERLAEPPGGWSALQKLAVCCPGLWHAGVLLECWDFGLERELGPSDQYVVPAPRSEENRGPNGDGTGADHACCYWTPVGDLPSEDACRVLEGSVLDEPREEGLQAAGASRAADHRGDPAALVLGLGFAERPETPGEEEEEEEEIISAENDEPHKRKDNPARAAAVPHCADVGGGEEIDSKKRKKESRAEQHLATGIWNLTREQGNKLLASRFRSDSLYICDWPGCIHSEERRKYRLFRGVFKNFQSSHVWRNIKDMKAKKTVVNCAFCTSEGTWDMLTTFCLRRSFEYHDDGQPAVRAYVCENGHVAGAWTDRPMYN